MEKETSERIAPTHEHTDLDAAFKAVYARYGSDLEAFFRDASKEAARHALEVQKCVTTNGDTHRP
jgi:hypothetical protein